MNWLKSCWYNLPVSDFLLKWVAITRCDYYTFTPNWTRVQNFLSVVLDIKSYWVNNFEEFGNSQIIKTQALTPAHSQEAFPSQKVSFHLLSNCLNHGSQRKALIPGIETVGKVRSSTQVRKSEIALFVKISHISADAVNPLVALLLPACGSQGCRRFNNW